METISQPYDELLEWDGISADAFEAISNLKNQALNAMSELGEWKDVEGFPNYQISSTGAFMNKRTLKMLKHFRHVESVDGGPCVTLYKGGVGNVLDVQTLLTANFGADAVLPHVNYFSHKLTELAPQKKKTKGQKTKFDPFAP